MALRREGLRRLKGARLSVWLCLALHVDKEGVSAPGVERIMRETGYARGTVCGALEELCSPELGLVEKLPPRDWGADGYGLLGYAWFGRVPAPTLYEE